MIDRDNKGRFIKGHKINNGRVPWCKGIKLPFTVWNKGVKMWLKRKHPHLGKKMSSEFRRKVSIGHKGQIPWNKNKKMPEISGVKHPRWKGGVWKYNKKGICPECGKVMNRWSKRCWDCYSKWLKKVRPIAWLKEKNPAWRNGQGYEPYSVNFTKELKEKIRKRDNYQCQNKECNMTEEEHLIVYGINLHIHHIDYDKKNCGENNLISLCLQCNTRANSNRDYWKKYYSEIISEVIKNGLLS